MQKEGASFSFDFNDRAEICNLYANADQGTLKGSKRPPPIELVFFGFALIIWPDFGKYYNKCYKKGKKYLMEVVTDLLDSEWTPRSDMVRDLTKPRVGKRRSVMNITQFNRIMHDLEMIKFIERRKNEKGNVLYKFAEPDAVNFLSSQPECGRYMTTIAKAAEELAIDYGSRLGIEPDEVMREIFNRAGQPEWHINWKYDPSKLEFSPAHAGKGT